MRAHTPRKHPPLERELARQVQVMINVRLPAGWSTTLTEDMKVADTHRLDAMITIRSPTGSEGLVAIEVKQSLSPRTLDSALDQIHHLMADYPRPTTPMIVSRYHSASNREWLKQRHVSFADATGNLHLTLEQPALYISDRGADRDPWRGPGRPPGDLKGPAAARVVRALTDFTPPVGIRELIRRSGASAGTTDRVVKFLDAESLLERSNDGRVQSVEWRRVIERWSLDYAITRDNAAASYLQPRGLAEVIKRLSESKDLDYALTGSHAAHRFAPYAPERRAMIYTTNVNQCIEVLDLREVEAGSNVTVAFGDYSVAFERTEEADGLRYVAPTQNAVDLLSGPGRNPNEGEALLDWMERNESVWRQ